MEYRGRAVIASKRNSQGVIVYIPEAMRVNGQKYICPFRLRHLKINPEYDLIYSEGCEVKMSLRFNTVLISISNPFTLATLQNIIDAQKHRGKGNRTITTEEYQQYIV